MSNWIPSLEWLAAFFEGEGHIGIGAQKRPRNVHGFKIEHMPMVTVTNTNRTLLEPYLRFGGSLYSKKANPIRGAPIQHWHQSYQWVAQSRSAYEAIRVLAPYLSPTGKGRQAQLFLEYYEGFKPPAGKTRYRVTPRVELLRREGLRQKISALNSHVTKASLTIIAESAPMRIKGLVGAKNPRARLTIEQVREIRAKMPAPPGQGKRGVVSLTSLAKEYGVTPGIIGHIVHGYTWKERQAIMCPNCEHEAHGVCQRSDCACDCESALSGG